MTTLTPPELQAALDRVSVGLRAAGKRNDAALARAVLREALWELEDMGGAKAVARPRDGWRFSLRWHDRERVVCDPVLARVDAEALWLVTGDRVAVVDTLTGADIVAFPDAYEVLGHA